MLLQDLWHWEKLAHFHREVIPERRMQAKGSGSFGIFTVNGDITQYTRARVFSQIGKQTDLFARFSTVAGERGAADAERDIRDYAVPGSRRVRRGTSSKVAEIDFTKPHGPLLLIGGEDDHIIPAALNLKYFKQYSDASSVADFRQFEGQCHVLIVDQNWKDVASYVNDWLDKR